MIVVIFEVWPVANRAREYFNIAVELKPRLQEIDGFISIERFESLVTKGKYLSLSFWRDEEAIRAWRNLEVHRQAQATGHESVFADTGYALHRSSGTTAWTSGARRLTTAAPQTANPSFD